VTGTGAALRIEGLCTAYDKADVLSDVSLTVEPGTITCLLGSNGSGKTTLIRSILGLTRPRSGTIRFGDADLTGLPAHRVVAHGIACIPEGRKVFPRLTVAENLALGAYLLRDKAAIRSALDYWNDIFPWLAARRNQPAGSLSGGEQQMLAVARALMTKPRILMCDEPSLGLAPTTTQSLFSLLDRLSNERGMAILLVEQNARLTLKIAHRAYVIESGEMKLAGSAAELRDNPLIRQAYLGA
jgi:branched-chain amino acid transport system ATP-binding protein